MEQRDQGKILLNHRGLEHAFIWLYAQSLLNPGIEYLIENTKVYMFKAGSNKIA